VVETVELIVVLIVFTAVTLLALLALRDVIIPFATHWHRRMFISKRLPSLSAQASTTLEYLEIFGPGPILGIDQGDLEVLRKKLDAIPKPESRQRLTDYAVLWIWLGSLDTTLWFYWMMFVSRQGRTFVYDDYDGIVAQFRRAAFDDSAKKREEGDFATGVARINLLNNFGSIVRWKKRHEGLSLVARLLIARQSGAKLVAFEGLAALALVMADQNLVSVLRPPNRPKTYYIMGGIRTGDEQMNTLVFTIKDGEEDSKPLLRRFFDNSAPLVLTPSHRR
jgi:hypothetical protein